MQLSLIAAMANNHVIGIENRLPWKLPADLSYFKQITLGKPVVMGRKTFESIGRPLPQRLNIILTRDACYQVDGCTVIHSLDNLPSVIGDAPEVMVIGGSQIYDQTLPMASTIYLTIVDCDVQGDSYFPQLDADKWHEESREVHKADEQNEYNYSFVRFTRRD